MATIIYGAERYEVPDDWAESAQQAILKTVSRGRYDWLALKFAEPGEQQTDVVQLLVGPGIPIGISFPYDTPDAANAALHEQATKARQRPAATVIGV